MLKINQLSGFGSGGAVPPSISFASIVKSAAAAQNHTFSATSIGLADPTRRLVFAVITQNSVAFRTVTVTVDGASPTSHTSVQGASFNGGRIEFFSILKPANTTADFQINTSGTNTHVTLIVWNAINEILTSPFATGTDGSTSGNQVDLTLNVPENGWIVAASALFGSPNPTGNTWTGITETVDDVVGTVFVRAGGANESFLAAQTGRNIICVVAGPSSSQVGCLAAMSWG